MPTRSFELDLCLKLIHTDTEDDVCRILEASGIGGDENWQPLGQIENNLSIAANQQSGATAALVEKLVNSIDSLLEAECLSRGVDPESAAAPRTMAEAAEMFFGIPGGNTARLEPPDRSRLADNIHVVATGSRPSPCITIIDRGEGQRPCDFSRTFCSLVRSNKLRIPFVQGKFNMGGCGVLPFCGTKNMQLIVSRRRPELCDQSRPVDESGWGWTVIRRREPDDGRRSSYFEYLAPGGQVPFFAADAIPVLATADAAYGGLLSCGSVLKLYNYQLEFGGPIVFDLNYELSRRLYRLALPIRLYERRDYRGHSRQTILTGMSVRLEDDRVGALEPSFPDSGLMAVDGVGDIPVEVSVFQKGRGGSYLSAQASILFLVNGQVHGTLGRSFLTRREVGLDFLKNDLMIVLDCTDMAARAREDLFMPSRDRLRDCSAKQGFERALEAYLADHEQLHRLNRTRRDDELRGRLADDRPLTEALKHVINTSPELRELFRLGTTLETHDVPGEEEIPFEGQEFPTFFRPSLRHDEDQPRIISCQHGGNGRARFETDAVNDYFTRSERPGTLTVTPPELFERVRLHDGRCVLVLRPLAGATIGSSVQFTVEVTDPTRTAPFSHRMTMVVSEPRTPTEGPSNPQAPRSGALALPKIVEVTQDRWEDEGFDQESGLAIQHDVDGGLVAKVNIDNTHLKRTLERLPEDGRELERKRFAYGLVLSGVAFYQEFGDRDDRDEIIRSTTRALARVLLPTIRILGALEHELVGRM